MRASRQSYRSSIAPTDENSRMPSWDSVLAVVAHPDDESFGLGAILDGFARTGATVSVLCLTRGEASTLGNHADLGWTLPAEVAEKLNEEFHAGFIGHGDDQVDVVVEVDREQQRSASLCHESQATPGSVLWRRLELLGGHEHLRWLRE